MKYRDHILILWALIILTISHDATKLCSCGCMLDERRALLDFKASINETRNAHLLLPSWVQEEGDHDCCNWERVRCSNRTGRIVELHLQDLREDLIESHYYYYREWFLNITTFLPLKTLRALDLSYNSFESEIQGCEKLVSLKNLESLNLDFNNFDNSVIPCTTAFSSMKRLSQVWNNLGGLFPFEEFSRLKQLEFLDLSFNRFSGTLFFKGCEQLASLKNLESLNLNGNNFNNSVIPCITVFPSMKRLSLAWNNLGGLFPFEEFNRMKQLQFLDLSHNQFTGSLSFKGGCRLKNLLELDLSWNAFSGSLPLCLSNLTSLRFLDISDNNFSGNIHPSIVSNLVHLEYISLSGNYFEGSFSFSSLFNHSNLQVFQFDSLGNDLHVEAEDFTLPATFQLRLLSLPGCNLNKRTRQIPSFLFYQKELRVLDLSSNNLGGRIPTWLLENNTQLEVLYLKNNSFRGSFVVNGTPKLNLIYLDISSNGLSGQIPHDIGLLFPTLGFLNLSTNSFVGHIPLSLANMTYAINIDLSNNKFSGEVQDGIANGCIQLQRLVLSNNHLDGHFPFSSMNSSTLEFLHLDDNFFTGNISDGLTYIPFLQFLDISNNKFQGRIPGWIGNFSSLKILDMSQNSLDGTIPTDICKLQKLSFLDLSQNQLSGSLPSYSNLSSLKFIHLQKNQITGSMSNALSRSFELLTIDLRDNQLSGSIPHYTGKLTQLRVLLLGGNNLRGQIPIHICQLKELTIVDLSNNSFSGPIPSCFGNISFGRGYFAKDAFDNDVLRDIVYGGIMNDYFSNISLHVQQSSLNVHNVSAVHDGVEFTTKSRTYTYAGNILNFMSGLDLSCNQLTGEIPPELGDLSDVRALNLSHNHLNGSIPSRLSMLRLMESFDLSYNTLSGEIPSQLANLNFLAVFNVSYNNLSGSIPDKGQFANLDESNYKGNSGLCGPLIKKNCNGISTVNPGEVGDTENHDLLPTDMVAFLWSFFAAYMVVVFALAIILCISPYYRRIWFGFIDLWILSQFYRYCNSRRPKSRR